MTTNKRDREVEAARKAAKVDLLPGDIHKGELIAYDVVVEVGGDNPPLGQGLIGRWTQTRGGLGVVTWTDGSHAETGSCEGDEKKIVEAVRESIPIRVDWENQHRSVVARKLRLLSRDR
jgi:hypothetical protein